MKNSRPRLAYFSPLPPVRSGVSDYSVELTQALSEYYELQIVIDDATYPTTAPIEWAEVVTNSSFSKSAAAREFQRLYHVGNNLHHEYIYDNLMITPGVVVLHDFCLHHFVTEKTLARGDAAGYLGALEACHGDSGAAIGRARVEQGLYHDALSFQLPVNAPVIAQAKGVVSHSRWACRRLAVDWPGKLITQIPFPVVPLENAPLTDAGSPLASLPRDHVLVGMLGFCTPPKQPSLVLRAIARARADIPNLTLVVVGEISDETGLRHEIELLGLTENVHIAGFVEFDRIPDYLSACDFFFSLRYPSAGETSAALFRVLERGKPAIVFDYGPFSEINDEIVYKVPLDTFNETQLAAAVVSLATNGSMRSSMGRAAASYVRTHHEVTRSARELAEFIRLCYQY